MWVATQFGFFSVVRDAQQPGNLLVRGRDLHDLEWLASKLGPPVSAVRITPDADYRYKLSAPAAQVAQLVAEQVSAIDYTNFKGQVAKVQGAARAHVYHDVWAALLPLQEASAAKERKR